MASVRPHPHLYEINTWPWLERLSREHGQEMTLGTVPDEQWDRLARRGIDLVYLLGVWRRSLIGRQIAQSDPGCIADYDRALPGWRPADVAGSAFCIAGYEPDPRIGDFAQIDSVRHKLHERGMRLVLDFVPNHLGFDHAWVATHPDRFVSGDEDAYRRNPGAFREIMTARGERRFIACGRDPYFAPWTDVAQLDYSREDTRRAMAGELKRVAEHADGARCDMAMLALSEVFARTWQHLRGPLNLSGEFWSEARAAVPGCLLLAEVYWDLEWRLQELGFDFTYDKRLYDRLLHGPADSVRGHLQATPRYQARSARFIENHDEPRSAATFGVRVSDAAVVMSTLPGLRFYYDGQFEGRRVRLPVQLGREPDEPVNAALDAFYERLLAIVNAGIFHDGAWALRDVRRLDDTSANLVAWRWKSAGELRLIVVNLGETASQAQVFVADDLDDLRAEGPVVFVDLLDGARYERAYQDLVEHGLYVRLEPGQAHILAVG